MGGVLGQQSIDGRMVAIERLVFGSESFKGLIDVSLLEEKKSFVRLSM